MLIDFYSIYLSKKRKSRCEALVGTAAAIASSAISPAKEISA
jgi:hypothetical protein